MRLSVCLLILTSAVPLCAQEPTPAETTPSVEAPEPEPKKASEEPGKDAAKDDDLAKDLSKGLESIDPTTQERDLLEEAIRGMRKAQERIEGSQTDEETRTVQKQVVKDLDDLIKQLQQQLQNPQSQSQSKQNQKQPKPLASVERPKPKPMPKPAGAKPEPQSAKPEPKDGAETSESKAERERKAAEEARRRKLNQDVWGHLPEHVRKQLANIQTDKYLPKYAESVRQYFDALAEQSRDR